MLALGASAHGASFFWSGDSDNKWSTVGGPSGTNWSSSPDFNQGTAGVPGATDDVFFNLASANPSNLATVLGADFSIRGLNFSPAATAPITIGGVNTLTLGLGGVTDNAATTITVSSAVALGSSQTWSNNTANAYTQSGVISGAAGSALTIAGSGNFNFTNANTYSGSTTIFTGSLTVSGAGAIANTSGISLNAGTTLNLDSTAGNHPTQNRIADSTTITSNGGFLNLLGNAGTPTTETVGTLAVGSGSSVVKVSGAGATLTFGTAGTTPSFSRVVGGTVAFQPAAGTTIKAPNVTLVNSGVPSNAIIGGFAVIGALDNSAPLDWATVDASNNVVPLAAYQTLTSTPLSTDNAKTVGGLTTLAAGSQTVNTFYSTLDSRVTTTNTGDTLVIGAGGIISQGATGTGHYDNKANITNMAFIGTQDSGTNNVGGTTPYFGNITSSTGDLVVITASNLRISSLITGNIGLTKSGAGVLDLSNGNTQNNKTGQPFTGNVTINEGILLINQENNLGNQNLASPVANAITFNGGELRTFAGTNFNVNRGFTVGTRGGVFSYSGGGNSAIQQKITGVGGFSYYSRQAGGGGGQTIHLNNSLGAGGFANHDYQGPTNFWFSYADGATGAGGNGTGTIIMDRSNQVPATSAVTINMIQDDAARTVVPNTVTKQLNMNGTAQSFGSLAGNVGLVNHNGALTLGANNLSTSFSGVISGTGTVIKVGSGTQTFSGNNNFTGATSINGGTLLIGTGTTPTSAVTFASPITVGNGTLTGALGGNGTLTSALIVSSTGHLAPAMSSSTFNTLTVNNNVTINPGGTLDYNFGSPGNGDLLNLAAAGNLSMGAGTDVLNVNQLGGFAIGTYNLITVSGTGSFTDNATFTINAKPNFNYAVLKPGDTIDPTAGGGTVPAGRLVLQVVAGNPLVTWLGTVNGTWDVNTTPNWGGDASLFTTGSNVTFDEFGAARPNVTVIAGGVTANSMTLANGVTNYTIGGGAITVTAGAGVAKSQAGSVTFNTNVTTPITTESGGSIIIGNGSTYTSTSKFDINGGSLAVTNGTLVTPALNVKAGTTLTVAATGSLGATTALDVGGTATFSNATQSLAALTGISSGVVNLNGPTALTLNSGSYDGTLLGAGSLTKAGTGLLVLTNVANSFSGALSVQNGTLSVPTLAPAGTAQPLGTATSALTLGAAGTAGILQYTGPAATLDRLLSLAPGGGGIESAGVGQLLTVNSTITNGANTLTLLGAGDGLVTTPLAGSGNVVKQGAGTWTLGGTGAPAGATGTTTFTSQAGTLSFLSNGTNSTIGAGSVTLNGGSMALSGTAASTFNNAAAVAQNGSITALQAPGGTAGLVVNLGGTQGVTIAAGKTLTLATANNYTLNVLGSITGAGALTSTGTVNLNAATNSYSGATSIPSGVLSVNGGLNTAGAVTVSGGTFNVNAPVTVGNLIVSTGTYNGGAALTTTSGVTVIGGLARITATGALGAAAVNVSAGTLQFDAGASKTAGYSGTGIVNDSLLQVKSGTADLGTTRITTNKPHASASVANQLQERYFRPSDAGSPDFLGTNGDPFISFEGTNTFLTRIPGATGALATNDLTFTGTDIQNRANALSAGFYGSTDNEGVAWVGKLNVGGTNLPAGPITFGTNSDDGSSLYIDSNQDGVFQPSERVVSNLGAHGVAVVTNTITLGAGSYNFAIGYYNGNGSAQMDAKFAAGTNIAFASQTFINPGAGIQLGVFSTPSTPGGAIQIDSGATLSAGGFTADAVNFSGGAGTLVLKANASLVNSAADSITTQGAGTTANLVLGANNALNVVSVNLGSNGTLIKGGVGSLLVSGAGSGLGTVNLLGGSLIVTGSISGSLVATGGILGGTGVITGSADIGAGAAIAPGVNGAGTLGIGDFNLNAPSAHLAIELGGTAPGASDRVSVTGAVNLTGDLLTSFLASYNPTVNDTFYLILNDLTDPVAGTFSNAVNQGNGTAKIDYGNGVQLLVNYSADAGTSNFTTGSGNDVAVRLLAVPEPSSAALLLAAPICLSLRRKRRSGALSSPTR